MPMELSRGTYFWRDSPGAPRVRLGRSRKEALQALPAAKQKAGCRPLPPKPRGARSSVKKPVTREALWRRVRAVLYSSMKKRAAERGMPIMSRDEFDAMWARAQGRCEVSGLRFKLTKMPKKLRRPWAPSVDRRDCHLGYTADNSRLVCTAVNIAMNEWGEETLRHLARAIAWR